MATPTPSIDPLISPVPAVGAVYVTGDAIATPPLDLAASPASFALAAPSPIVALINSITDRFKFPGPLKIWNGTTFSDAPFKSFDGSTIN